MYTQIRTDIFQVMNKFNLASSVPLFPVDYTGSVNPGDAEDAYILFELLLPNIEIVSYSAGVKIEGYLIFNIYTRKGFGPKKALEVADTLNTYFQGTTVNGRLQFFQSNLSSTKEDTDNHSLNRTEYMIRFNTYGDL